ncbi:hypothetical protein [Janthinobacterium sp. PAMC25594]|uniref:hypothetical protein n=1 Tax=Janthinobacterium sp. PAMC25594 TaxID=2861284 RepID=UPI001C628151|nr:hypothetical protein [Janthinobacterium sp. PAMC25594]QYG06257.1 hypothetical protein KY494_23785 [Janthinobacterium sp. PAMC25594]
MAKTINKNWALIESMGYTIQQTFSYSNDTRRFVAVPLRECIEREIGGAIGDEITTPAGYKGPGADLSRRAGNALKSSCRFVQIRYKDCCNDLYGFHIHGLSCVECATALFTPEVVRALNGEAAWAAARKGSALDRAMAEIIATTPAIQAEIERRALAAILPATPTATRRPGGRL